MTSAAMTDKCKITAVPSFSLNNQDNGMPSTAD